MPSRSVWNLPTTTRIAGGQDVWFQSPQYRSGSGSASRHSLANTTFFPHRQQGHGLPLCKGQVGRRCERMGKRTEGRQHAQEEDMSAAARRKIAAAQRSAGAVGEAKGCPGKSPVKKAPRSGTGRQLGQFRLMSLRSRPYLARIADQDWAHSATEPHCPIRVTAKSAGVGFNPPDSPEVETKHEQ